MTVAYRRVVSTSRISYVNQTVCADDDTRAVTYTFSKYALYDISYITVTIFCYYRQGSNFAKIFTIQAYECKDAVLLFADLRLILSSHLVTEAVHLRSCLSKSLPTSGRIIRYTSKQAKTSLVNIFLGLSLRIKPHRQKAYPLSLR